MWNLIRKSCLNCNKLLTIGYYQIATNQKCHRKISDSNSFRHFEKRLFSISALRCIKDEEKAVRVVKEKSEEKDDLGTRVTTKKVEDELDLSEHPEVLRQKRKRISKGEMMERANIVKKDADFSRVQVKNPDTFNEVVEVYLQTNEKYRRHHVEFVYAAMKRMDEFGVKHDLVIYKRLLELFPKGKMVATNTFQRDFQHYPKQQQCVIDLLDQMEDHGIMPDRATGMTIMDIFGKFSYAHRKYCRMMYWMPKFKNITLWPLPSPLPDESVELAKLALERITAVDKRTVVSVFKTEEDDSEDGKSIWIASAQSPVQKHLLLNLKETEPLYVTGPFRIYLRTVSLFYFMLKAEKLNQKEETVVEDWDDVALLPVLLTETQETDRTKRLEPSVHEQEDGTIMALTITQTSNARSLSAWIHFLQQENPCLQQRSVVFSLSHFPEGETSLVTNENLATK